MGWMRTLLLGDIGNRLDIADAERNVSALQLSHKKTVQNLQKRNREIDRLQDELARQKLATQALTRFLVQKGLINEAELEDFIGLVDAEDGVIDGKMTLDTAMKPRLIFTSQKKIPRGTFRDL
jgi:hypothetical protein